MKNSIDIYRDSSGITFGYTLKDENGDILSGDGYETVDSLINDLKNLKESLEKGLKNVEELS